MDPCHSVTAVRSPARTSAVTVARLISNIEQLKNKDKLISQLEKDLGHQWVSAQQAALERAAACWDGSSDVTSRSALPPLSGTSTQQGLGGEKQQQQHKQKQQQQQQQQSVACDGTSALPSNNQPSPSPAVPPKGSNQGEDEPTGLSSRIPSSAAATCGVEDVWSTPFEGSPLSKHDLQKALKESKERSKELLEKCRAYLHRTKELTAQNRAFKDSSVKLLDENKKMEELLEHSKLRCLQLSRAANAAGAERSWAEQTSQVVEQAKSELAEAHKTIAALRQACSDKDRRIELIQHRKKRRRLAIAAENRFIGGETYFGYEDDTNSMDSSLSRSTASDDDVWDDVLSSEEMERNYQRLRMEHLQLQKSFALLQNQTGALQDPHREEKAKHDLQNDLFQAQCRIENLERLLAELGEGEIRTLLKEREILMSDLRASKRKMEGKDQDLDRVQRELSQAKKRVEDLEFQLVEMQQVEENKTDPPCPGQLSPTDRDDEALHESHPPLTKGYNQQQQQHQQKQPLFVVAARASSQVCTNHRGGDPPQAEKEEEKAGGGGSVASVPASLASSSSTVGREFGAGAATRYSNLSSCSSGGCTESSGSFQLLLASLCVQRQRLDQALTATEFLGPGMEQLKTDLAALLKGKGKQAESALKRLENITQEEKSHRESLEFMAHELQMKVISLQQEMDVPQMKTSAQAKGHNSGKRDNSLSAAEAREKQENLELKDENERPPHSELPLSHAEREQVCQELSDWKAQCGYLKEQLYSLSGRKHTSPIKHEIGVQTSSPPKPMSPPLAELTRKNSKDRKSRPRSGDDPTTTKRRRSSHDCSSGCKLPPSGLVMKNARSVGDLKTMNGSFEDDQLSIAANASASIGDLDMSYRGLCSANKENAFVRGKGRKREVDDRMEAEADQGYQSFPHLFQKATSYPSLTSSPPGRLNPSLAQTTKPKRAFRDTEDESLSDVSSSSGSSFNQTLEMEELVEQLKEQLLAREVVERQLRERLRLVEVGAEEAEAAEIQTRDKFEALLASEAENSRQLRQMQGTYRELRDILVDKEIVEQALSDKVDFLQRAEAASVRRVEELEAEVKELKDQLEEALKLSEDPSGSNQRELNKIQELKHQMTFLDTDNRALQARIGELEENEETLRENWRKVAEEDFSRIKSLEEKVKRLEGELAEAQEYYVINTIPGTSLAAELEDSQASLSLPEDVSDGTASEDNLVEPSGILRKDSEKRSLRDKVKILEKQLSDVAESKNTTIENLQEKMGALKENEIKLSETISEMEMTERELRAKLALYESSEVTVEKMLKYQSKIEELRTSQESLLDQLEAMENQEMTLQEKMQEMERQLRGKIVTLEVEMKGYKTREHKDAGRIRELEKAEKELSEKTAQQAEKENGLYVKISSLMEENKTAKEQVETLTVQVADKEDKVRKAKLLEVKFLEIEMEFSKKMSDLSSKLRHKEEELRQKEVAHEEQVSALKEESALKDSENSNKLVSLEKALSEQESKVKDTVSGLKKRLREVSDERDGSEAQLASLTEENEKLCSKQKELDQEIADLKEEISGLNNFETESQRMVKELEENLDMEKSFTEEAENKVKSLLEDIAQGKETIAGLESQIAALTSELKEKQESEVENYEKEKEWEREKLTLANEIKLKNDHINELEKQVGQHADKIVSLECDLRTMEENHRQDVDSMEEQQKVLENELNNKVLFLNTQLNTEVETRESERSALQQSNKREEGLTSQVTSLEKEVNALKKELVAKLSELEVKNKEVCELSLKLSNAKHSSETLRHELQLLKESSAECESKLRKEISTSNAAQEKLEVNLKKSEAEIKKLQLELAQKENILVEVGSEKDKIVEEKHREIARLQEEKVVQEKIVQQQIQKSESSVLQSKQDSQKELASLTQRLADEEQKHIKQSEEKRTLEGRIEDLESQIQTLELYLSEVNFKLDSKSSQCRKREEELEETLAQNDRLSAELNTLSQQLAESKAAVEAKKAEVTQKATENSDSLSLVSAKQRELDNARSELQKCLQEIDNLKTQVKSKENEAETFNQEQKALSTNYEELQQLCLKKDVDIKQMKSEVNNFELHLKEAENRYRELEAKYASLELQYEERVARAEHGEEILRSRETEANALATKLKDLQEECSKSEILLSEKDANFENLESKLREMEKEKFNLEQSITDKKMENEELRSKFKESNNSMKQLSTQLKEFHGLHERLVTVEEELARSEQELRNSEAKQSRLQEELIESEQQVSKEKQHKAELSDRLHIMEERLNKTDTSVRDAESDRMSLEQQLVEVKMDNQNLHSKITDLQNLLSQSQTLQKGREEKVKEMELALNDSRIETLNIQNQFVDKETSLVQAISDLEHAQHNAQTMKEESQRHQNTINYLEQQLQQSLEGLQENQDLSSQLADLKDTLSNNQNTITALEKEIANVNDERDQLTSKVITMEKELSKIQMQKTSLTEELEQKSAFCEKLKSDAVDVQSENSRLLLKCKALEEDGEILKRQQNERHSVERDALESRLEEAESMCRELLSDLDRVRQETDLSSLTISDLENQLKQKAVETENLEIEVTDLKISVKRDEERADKINEMQLKLEAFQKSENINAEKLRAVEKELESMIEKDGKLSLRVEELEGQEKALLEQMADIETTVIVPLETENQELKDEIAIMRQEREDAVAQSGRSHDDENQMSYREVLEQRDEMEKKIDILLSDIAQLETERDSMTKKIADLHASNEDMAEKCELLEVDVDRLRDMERQSSVVEEAETRLMDRVLDLEDRERHLASELRQLKDKDFQSVGCQTGEAGSVLVPCMAEEVRYMTEKQMVNKPSHITMSSRRKTSSPVNEDPSASTSNTIYPSTTCISNTNAELEPVVETLTKAAAKDPSQSSPQTEQTVQTDNELSIESKTPDQRQELEESYRKIHQLEGKIELLQDSEARLMERLLETEERMDSAGPKTANTHDKSGETEKQAEIQGLKDKIDILTEEIEFLTGSIENYKKMYKEVREEASALNEKVQDASSVYHDLEESRVEVEEARAELEETQAQLDNLKAQQLDDLEREESKTRSMLDESQVREAELRYQLQQLQEHEKFYQQTISEHEESERQLKEQVVALETRVNSFHLTERSFQEEKDELEQQIVSLRKRIEDSHVRESSLGKQILSLEQEVQKLSNDLRETRQSHVVSGTKSTDRVKSPPTVSEEKFTTSTASVNLHRRANAASPSSTHSGDSSHHGGETPPPVAPPRPRGRRSRPSSIDSVSQEELVFLVEELQAREAVLKRRIHDLEATTSDLDLSERVEELEKENKRLQQTLSDQSRQRNDSPLLQLSQREHLTQQAQRQNNLHTTTRVSHQAEAEGAYVSLLNPSYYYPGGDSNNNSSSLRDNNNTASSSSRRGRAESPSTSMLDKPGDVLQQRIKELEHLDAVNKDQLSELERDREVLHEIARKDKATIHDLNVRIRELQLSERSLKEQVSSLEVSESSLFSRCEDLDTERSRLEDRVHELEVHERRLRELVRRLKLDEERWLGRSGGMETALGELSASESQLKRLLQDAEMEKGGLAERMSYIEGRVSELEAVEANLLQRIKALQMSETNLQKQLSQMENSEAAAHSKAAELDVLNADLTQRLQAGLEERAVMGQHLQQLHGQMQELDRRLLTSRDSEMAYKQHVESLQKNESCLQKRVREFELREIDSQARVRELEQTHEIMGDKMAALQRSENRLKYRVQELEGMGGQIPGELTPAQKQKLPQKLEDCQKQIVVLQNHVGNLQVQLRETLKQSQHKLASMDGKETVPVPVSELSLLRTRSTLLEESNYQMQEVERVNQELTDTILRLQEGKGVSGREVEVEVLRRRLASYKECIAKLKSSLSTGQATSLVDPELDSGPDGETLPARHLHGLESERVLQSVRGLEDRKANGLPVSSQGLAAQESSMVQSKAAQSLSSAPLSLDMSFAGDTSSVSPDMDQDPSLSAAHQPDQMEENHWRAIEARRIGAAAAGLPRGGEAWTAHSSNSAVPPHRPVLHTGTNVSSSGSRLGPGGAERTGKSGKGGNDGVDIEEVTVALHLQSESEMSSHHTSLRHSSHRPHSNSSKTGEAAGSQNDTDSSLSPVPPPRKSRKSAGPKGTGRGADAKVARLHHGSNSSDGDEGGANYIHNTNSSGQSETKDSINIANDVAVPTSPRSPAADIVSETTNQKLFFGKGQKKPLPHGQEYDSSMPEAVDSDHNTSSSHRKSPRTPLSGFGKQDSFYLPSPAQDAGDSLGDDDGPPPPLPTSLPPGCEAVGQRSGGSSSPSQEAGSGKESLDASTSGMSIRQRIAMIEKQLQPDQFDSKVGHDQSRTWETQAHEKSKQVELLEKDNKYLREDINKLEKELEEKRRHLNILETWLSSLDDLLKNKNKQTDREMVEQLQMDLTKLRSELKRVGHRPEGDIMDPAALRTELEHRDKEIVSKRTELQSLAQELHKCKAECRSIEGMRRTALDSLRCLEEEVVTLQEKETRMIEAEEELDELRARTEKTREVFEENLLLRDKVHQGELELRRLRGLCDDFNNLSARYEEMEHYKQQALDLVQPLEAKVERLSRKCQQKDALLLDLGDELRNNSSKQSRALDELARMEKIMAVEEYNTDLPPLTNGLDSGTHRRPFPSRSSSMEELDSHLNPVAPARERRRRPAPYINDRPRSADGILRERSGPLHPPAHHYQQDDDLENPLFHKSFPADQRSRSVPVTAVQGRGSRFRVIADYDPSVFSQSGKPGLELHLMEGDIVNVTGPMDRAGYYEAEVKGRSGLVPANYLWPVQPAGPGPARSHQARLPRPGVDQSPEHILDMFNQLQHEGNFGHRSNGPRDFSLPVDAWPPSGPPYHGPAIPEPPHNLHVKEGDDGDGTYLLTWQPPKLDSNGQSNGLQVLGYMVYVDYQEYEQVPSAALCQVVLDSLKPGQSHTLAVQALCGGGQASAKAQLFFQGAVTAGSQGPTNLGSNWPGQTKNEKVAERRAEEEDDGQSSLDTDLSSVLNRTHKKGQKRKVLALYDYNPAQESPGDYPHLELAFQAGDLMIVYGAARPDGFLHGEVDGKKGLVPACFVEDVSESQRRMNQRVPTGAGEMNV